MFPRTVAGNRYVFMRPTLFLVFAFSVGLASGAPLAAQSLNIYTLDPAALQEESLGYGDQIAYEIGGGEPDSIQRVTATASASFTTLTRNAAGDLFGISDSNTLVALDEETGTGSVVAVLNQASGNPFDVLGLAFVPLSEGETLFALIRFGSSEIFPTFDEPVIEETPAGVRLALVDQETGALELVDLEIPGPEGYGKGAEALAYWEEEGKLIRAYHEWGWAVIQTIDLETGEIASLDAFRSFDEEEEFVNPYRFDGIVGLGGGVFGVYDGDRDAFLEISLFQDPYYEGGPEEVAPFVFQTRYLYSPYQINRENGPEVGTPIRLKELSSIQNLELSSSGDLLVERSGKLERYPRELTVENEEDVWPAGTPTRVDGLPAAVYAMATHPLTGETYYFVASGNREEGPFSKYTEKGIQIVSPDEDGPGIALGDFEIPFASTYGDTDEEPLSNRLFSIAFDSEGRLFGINDDSILVEIDQETGEVTAVEGFGSIDSYYWNERKLVWNAAEERFYVAFSDYDEDLDARVLMLGTWDENGEFEILSKFGGHENDWFSGIVHTDRGFLFSVVRMPWSGPVEEGAPEFATGFYLLDENDELVLEEEVPAIVYLMSVAVSPDAVPDLLIGLKERDLIGQGVHTTTGVGQTLSLRKTHSRMSGEFHAVLENDGHGSGVFAFSGTTGSTRDDVVYLLDGENVTTLVKAGMEIPLAGGESSRLRVTFSRAGKGSWNQTFVLALGEGDRRDVGRVVANLRTPKPKPRRKPNRNARPTGLF